MRHFALLAKLSIIEVHVSGPETTEATTDALVSVLAKMAQRTWQTPHNHLATACTVSGQFDAVRNTATSRHAT